MFDQENIQIYNFPQDGALWRIESLGHVYMPDIAERKAQYSVEVVLGHLDIELDELAVLGTVNASRTAKKFVTCSIGWLMFLCVGDIWRDGKRVFRPNYQQEQFRDLEIDENSAVLVKLGLPPDGTNYLLPKDYFDWHLPHTQAYAILVNLADGRKALFPCWELIRFYFGSSSALLNALFTFPFTLGNIVDIESSSEKKFLSTSIFYLALKGIKLRASAVDVARMYGSATALKAAKQIANSCVQANVRGQVDKIEKPFPSTKFPFTGKTSLTVKGQWLPHAGRVDQTFIVFRIEQCTYPFPFSELKYHLVGDKGYKLPQFNNSNLTSTNRTVTQRVSKPAIPVKLQVADKDSSKALQSQATTSFVDHRFPDLMNKQLIYKGEFQVDNATPVQVSKTAAGDMMFSVGESYACGRLRMIDFEVNSKDKNFGSTLPKFFLDCVRRVQDDEGGIVSLLVCGDSRDVIFRFPEPSKEFNNPHLYLHDKRGRLVPRRFGFIVHSLDDAHLVRGVIEPVNSSENAWLLDFVQESELLSLCKEEGGLLNFFIKVADHYSSHNLEPSPQDS